MTVLDQAHMSQPPPAPVTAIPPQKPERLTFSRTLLLLTFSFARRTSIHGLPRVLSTGTRPGVSFLWMVIVLLTMGFSVFHLLQLVKEFSRYPLTIKRSASSMKAFEAPDVTICPLALFNGYFLSQQRTLYRHKIFDEYMKKSLFGCEQALNNCTKCDYNCDVSKHMLRSRYFDTEFFLRAKDIVIACSFNTAFCSFRNMSVRPDPSYTQCFTISLHQHILETGERGG